jgi:hypothetical protein
LRFIHFPSAFFSLQIAAAILFKDREVMAVEFYQGWSGFVVEIKGRIMILRE